MYVSSYYYRCVLILLYMCSQTTMCPHTTIYVSLCYYIYVSTIPDRCRASSEVLASELDRRPCRTKAVLFFAFYLSFSRSLSLVRLRAAARPLSLSLSLALALSLARAYSNYFCTSKASQRGLPLTTLKPAEGRRLQSHQPRLKA